jgi:hypothetical protein
MSQDGRFVLERERSAGEGRALGIFGTALLALPLFGFVFSW